MIKRVRTLGRLAAFCAVLGAGAGIAEAVPVLQLDIIGGSYDAATQTIVSNGPTFTLVAVLTPSETAAANQNYYISAALTPQTGQPGGSFGSFSWNGTTIQATSQMTYGTPPIEASGIATADPGDLASHGIYPTYFYEAMFNFSGATAYTAGTTAPGAYTGATYNSALTPGGVTAGTGSYYRFFSVQSNLTSPYSLHFDMYDTVFKTQCTGGTKTRTCSYDEDIDHFAPFSHDAAIGPALPPPPAPVPEPATLLMVSLGLAATVRHLRRTAA